MRAARIAALLCACAAACSLYGEDAVTPPTASPLDPGREAGIDGSEAVDVSLEDVDGGEPDADRLAVEAGNESGPPLRDLLVFITKEAVAGNFGDGFPDQTADQICRDAAIGLGSRKFRALLSGISFDARERVLKLIAGHRIVLANSSAVAQRGEKMLGNSLLRPIDFDESGNYWPPNTPVWTGMNVGGSPSAAVCGNWSSNASNEKAAAGSVRVGADWAYGSLDACSTPHHFYCFEVP